MTVVVACRAADGTLVFGSDRRFSSEDEIHNGKKLYFHPMMNGSAVMGMAAEDAKHGFAHVVDLQIALNRVTFDQDPTVVVQEGMKNPASFGAQNETSEEVEILCGIASPALRKPKLLGVFGRATHDLDEKSCCCIGSGAGPARGFLKLASNRLNSLWDVQLAVCASVWLAKETDPRCGGETDIWWLSRDGKGELEVERIKAFEGYIETSLLPITARWIADAPL